MSPKVKCIALFFLIAASTAGQAQSKLFRRYDIDLGMLYNIPTDSKLGEAGVGLYIEPKFYASTAFRLGVRAQGDLLGDFNVKKSSHAYSIKAMGSYQFTTDYLFRGGKVQPYVGLGMGYFRQEKINSTDGGVTVTEAGGESFGLSPRAGLEFKHLSVAAIYNVTTGSNMINYMSLNFGYIFPGRK